MTGGGVTILPLGLPLVGKFVDENLYESLKPDLENSLNIETSTQVKGLNLTKSLYSLDLLPIVKLMLDGLKKIKVK